MKTFKCAGVSKHNGKMSFRATNRDNPIYPDLLKKEGHTDIHIVELKSPMTKEDARKYLQARKEFQTPEIMACLKQTDSDEKQTAKAKANISKPTKSKKPATAKMPAKKKKDKETNTPNPDVATADHATDDDVDVAAEVGIPPFVKHIEEGT